MNLLVASKHWDTVQQYYIQGTEQVQLGRGKFGVSAQDKECGALQATLSVEYGDIKSKVYRVARHGDAPMWIMRRIMSKEESITHANSTDPVFNVVEPNEPEILSRGQSATVHINEMVGLSTQNPDYDRKDPKSKSHHTLWYFLEPLDWQNMLLRGRVLEKGKVIEIMTEYATHKRRRVQLPLAVTTTLPSKLVTTPSTTSLTEMDVSDDVDRPVCGEVNIELRNQARKYPTFSLWLPLLPHADFVFDDSYALSVAAWNIWLFLKRYEDTRIQLHVMCSSPLQSIVMTELSLRYAGRLVVHMGTPKEVMLRRIKTTSASSSSSSPGQFNILVHNLSLWRFNYKCGAKADEYEQLIASVNTAYADEYKQASFTYTEWYKAELPMSNSFRSRGNIAMIWSALGPNMSTVRVQDPAIQKGGYEKSLPALSGLYEALFNDLAEYFDLKCPKSSTSQYETYKGQSLPLALTKRGKHVIFDKLKLTEVVQAYENNSQSVKTQDELFPSAAPPEYNTALEHGKPNNNGHWRDALKPYVSDAKMSVELSERVYLKDSKVVVLYDMFPKAQVHLLMLSRKLDYSQVNELSDLSYEHLDVLQDMRDRCDWIVENKLQHQFPELGFYIGFHARPSLNVLHVHIISRDFRFLKRKKHWMSFLTSLFVPLDDAVELLEKKTRKSFSYLKSKNLQDKMEELEKSSDFECPKCEAKQKGFPAALKHFLDCKSEWSQQASALR